jgi:hypothetical protein
MLLNDLNSLKTWNIKGHSNKNEVTMSEPLNFGNIGSMDVGGTEATIMNVIKLQGKGSI